MHGTISCLSISIFFFLGVSGYYLCLECYSFFAIGAWYHFLSFYIHFSLGVFVLSFFTYFLFGWRLERVEGILLYQVYWDKGFSCLSFAMNCLTMQMVGNR